MAYGASRMPFSCLEAGLADHVLCKPDVPIGINIDANADVVQRLAKEMDAMPACWRLIDHRLLDLSGSFPGSGEGTGIANVFAAICVASEPLCGNAVALLLAIGAGMAETAMIHIPAVQACASRERPVPLERIEAACRPIAVNLREQLLG